MTSNGNIGKIEAAAPGYHYRLVAGQKISFDKEGFLWQPDDWSEEIALVLAQESGLDNLHEEHWLVIDFLRTFYYNNGRVPLNRQIRKGTSMSILAIEKLFPEGVKNGARRIAGLPNPKACV